MTRLPPRALRAATVAVAASRGIRKQREAAYTQAVAAVKARMQKRKHAAIAFIAAFAVAGSGRSDATRTVQRALGKWRGSTIAGYLHAGDEQTYKTNFRMSKETFSLLAGLLARPNPSH